MNYTIFDGLALSDLHFEPDHPKPFRLFAAGETPLTRNGAPCVLNLSAEDIKAMADHQHNKGRGIHIDSRHALFFAAEKAGVSEAEAVSAEKASGFYRFFYG